MKEQSSIPAFSTVAGSRAPRRRIVGAFSAAAIVVLSACGSGSDSPSGPDNNSVYPSTLVPVSNAATPGTRTSQAPTNGQPPGPSFDDFTLSNGGSVRTFSWQGTYCRQTANSGSPAPTVSSFVVSIYSDASGRPNLSAPLRTASFTASQANESLDKTVAALACGSAANTTWGLYSYSVTLPSAFTAAAGTKYWISVVGTTPTYDVIWGWRDGTAANNLSLQLFQGTYTTATIDRAFAIAP